jgi:catechol 2,3-dioxygenase-like lactoylglutathione lyase family enzyme
MLGQAPVIGFVPVKDLVAAETFYRGALGLTVEHNDGFALVLRAAGGMMIRLVTMPGMEAQQHTILGWEVGDIHAAVKNLRAAGVEPKRYPNFQQDEDGVWTAPDGSEVVWFTDPSENVLSISHHLAATEEAVGE